MSCQLVRLPLVDLPGGGAAVAKMNHVVLSMHLHHTKHIQYEQEKHLGPLNQCGSHGDVRFWIWLGNILDVNLIDHSLLRSIV